MPLHKCQQHCISAHAPAANAQGSNYILLARLLHLQAQVLDSSPYKWLHELLECFNHGDLHQYDALCAKHAAVLNAQPALVENERRLREKVREGCLCY